MRVYTEHFKNISSYIFYFAYLHYVIFSDKLAVISLKALLNFTSHYIQFEYIKMRIFFVSRKCSLSRKCLLTSTEIWIRKWMNNIEFKIADTLNRYQENQQNYWFLKTEVLQYNANPVEQNSVCYQFAEDRRLRNINL